jgi:hypothetical protein
MVVITTVTAQRAKRASQANGDTQKTPKALQINRESRTKIATALYIKTPKAL